MALEINKRSVINWMIASIIAAAIVIMIVASVNARRHESIPCKDKTCYLLLDKRLTVLETAIECPNNQCDRFKGKDAAAMEKRINDRIDRMEKD